jgi:hypothetical protein
MALCANERKLNVDMIDYFEIEMSPEKTWLITPRKSWKT